MQLKPVKVSTKNTLKNLQLIVKKLVCFIFLLL